MSETILFRGGPLDGERRTYPAGAPPVVNAMPQPEFKSPKPGEPRPTETDTVEIVRYRREEPGSKVYEVEADG